MSADWQRHEKTRFVVSPLLCCFHKESPHPRFSTAKTLGTYGMSLKHLLNEEDAESYPVYAPQLRWGETEDSGFFDE
jgi:hypothetical protein